MRRKFFTMLVCFVGISGWVPAWAQVQEREPETKEQLQQMLQGTWRPETGVLGGNDLPKEVLDAIQLSIKEWKFEVDANGVNERGELVIESEEPPWKMLIRPTEGPNAGNDIPAIIKFDKDQKLIICYDLDRKDYPESFESPRGSMQLLLTYVRVPEEKKEIKRGGSVPDAPR